MASPTDRMRLTVDVLPLTVENARGPNQAAALAAFKPTKFALPVQLEQTLEQVWVQVEKRYTRNYLTPLEASSFTIKKLQDAYDCDLDLSDTVGAIFEGETDAQMRMIKVVPGFIDRDFSVPPTSHLIPTHIQKRTRLSTGDQPHKRRRLAEEQPEQTQLDPMRDRPVPSKESAPIKRNVVLKQLKTYTRAQRTPQRIQHKANLLNSAKVPTEVQPAVLTPQDLPKRPVGRPKVASIWKPAFFWQREIESLKLRHESADRRRSPNVVIPYSSPVTPSKRSNYLQEKDETTEPIIEPTAPAAASESAADHALVDTINLPTPKPIERQSMATSSRSVVSTASPSPAVLRQPARFLSQSPSQSIEPRISPASSEYKSDSNTFTESSLNDSEDENDNENGNGHGKEEQDGDVKMKDVENEPGGTGPTQLPSSPPSGFQESRPQVRSPTPTRTTLPPTSQSLPQLSQVTARTPKPRTPGSSQITTLRLSKYQKFPSLKQQLTAARSGPASSQRSQKFNPKLQSLTTLSKAKRQIKKGTPFDTNEGSGSDSSNESGSEDEMPN
ncbi:hypothetical protein BDV95DRAFT_602484 [Massariosphaeria phaeospora]|uniref:Nucleolar protein Dnt1-like N-terminal domain-containing protein n=1 Tax=Massariosphaeria phaeospora TaxID=100035 RepID=A0A7C8MWA5_9PLEO|nr:hypothetical protein BDV95DRAFT_602484 [Massariosphaeria phaeospora]